MPLSTKIDLFETPSVTTAVGSKTSTAAARTDDISKTSCTQEPMTSSRRDASHRCLSTKALLVVLCVSAAAAAYHKYTAHNIRLLSDRLQFLENRCNELLLLSQKTSSGDDYASKHVSGDTRSITSTVTGSRQLVEKVEDNKPEVSNTESGGRGDEEWGLGELGSGFYDIDALVNDDELPSSGEELEYKRFGMDNPRQEQPKLLERDLLMIGEGQGKVKLRSRRSTDNVVQGMSAAGMTSELKNTDEGDASIYHLPVSGDRTVSTADQRSRHSRSAEGGTQNQRHAGSRQSDRAQRQRHNSSLQATHAIKVAQFVAPRREDHYVSDSSLPPVTYRFWQPDNLTLSLNPQFFSHDNETGLVTILEPGIYLLYAQIVFHDLTGRWAYGVYVDDVERFKCMTTEQLHHHPHHHRDSDQTGSRTANSHSVYQSCYTSGLLRLKKYDKLSLRCLYGGKSVVMQPGFTYWGLVKLISF